MSTCRPYACAPLTIDVGPGLATYWVPKHLLSSLKWSNANAGETICLPGVSAATGHTLVHYLYTGTYQALESKGGDGATPAQVKFKQALLTFILASRYELQGLERLAREQIQALGSHLALVEVLDTVRKEFSRMNVSWFHEYLQARAKEQFDIDYTFFTSKDFIDSVGKGTLHRFITSHLLEIFSDKLALADAAAGKPHQSGGHETERRASDDDMSFELTNAPGGDVDDVISLKTSSVPDSAEPEHAIDDVPHVEASNITEEQDTVQTEPDQACCEEPYEQTYGNEVNLNEYEDTAPEPVPDIEEATGMECQESEAPPGPVPAPPELEKEETDPWSFASFATTGVKKKKKKKGIVMEAPLPEPPNELPADPEPVLEPPTEPEPALEPEPVSEGDQWGFAATKTEKIKNGEEREVEPETAAADLPLPHAETVPVTEEAAVDPYVGLTKSAKKKLMARRAREAEEAALIAEEEEAMRAEAEAEAARPAEEEEAAAAAESAKKEEELWGGFAATTIGKKKKKSKKYHVQEEAIPVPEEPESEPVVEPEASYIPQDWSEPEQETPPEEAVSVASRTFCSRPSHPRLKDDRWKKCERCRTMLGEIAMQLAKENRAVLLSEKDVDIVDVTLI
jgi:hypothetical protein